MKTENWRDKFDKEIPEDYFQHSNCECWNETGEPNCWQKQRMDVEKLVQSLLDKQREEMEEILKKWSLYHLDYVKASMLCSDVRMDINKIKEM